MTKRVKGTRKMIPLPFRILLEAVLVLLAVAFIAGWRALRPVRMPLTISPKELGLPEEKIELLTDDGKKLAGWLIVSGKATGVVVCLHGYPANRSDILPAVAFLYPHFSLLLFDFRAHGESNGKVTYFGLKETADVKAALDFLENDERTKSKPVALWGYSLGAAVGILSAARDERIKAVVSDSAFANFPEMVTQYYRQLGPLRYLLSPLSRMLGRVFLQADFIENSPEYAIGQVRCPILFIHSRRDELVPPEHAFRLYQKATSDKQLFWKDGRHAGGMSDEQRCQQAILSFLKKYL
ncbi:MAG: alpha/beta fold hydrolase [Candidatus Omnitrophica bacterium]|nr:alpha/beta fold hydrolase [Candidatus Omnitrophota bacterium]